MIEIANEIRKEPRQTTFWRQIKDDISDSNFSLCFYPAKRKELLGKETGLLTDVDDDTRNLFNMQRITPNSKRWDYLDIPGGGT